MTVLYIIDPGIVGGATISFLEVVKRMKSIGVTPIVCTGVQNELNDKLTDIGIENICIGHRTVLAQTGRGIRKIIHYIFEKFRYEFCKIKAVKIVEEKVDLSRVDLIHTNSARNDIGCYLNKKYGIPHVMHIREFSDLDFGCTTLNVGYIKMYNQYTTRFIAISKAIKKYWSESKGIINNKITTIYNGINYNDISLSCDKCKKNKILKVVIVGGVYPTKGQHLLVDAICMLPIDIRQNILLDVIGWGSPKYIETMKIRAKANHWLDNLHFLGSRNDVHSLLGNYDIGCMCSRSEGFGRATAEYMHAQLGVIASDSGACPELIENGVCGQLFENGNAQDLARCIERYYNDRDLLIQHSHEARKKALCQYTDEINAQNIYKLYEEILNGNS